MDNTFFYVKKPYIRYFYNYRHHSVSDILFRCACASTKSIQANYDVINTFIRLKFFLPLCHQLAAFSNILLKN